MKKYNQSLKWQQNLRKGLNKKNPDEEFVDDEIDRVYLGIRQIG